MRRQAQAIHLVNRDHPEVEATRIVVGTAELMIPNGGVIVIDEKGNCHVTVDGVSFYTKVRRPASRRNAKPAATASGNTQ